MMKPIFRSAGLALAGTLALVLGAPAPAASLQHEASRFRDGIDLVDALFDDGGNGPQAARPGALRGASADAPRATASLAAELEQALEQYRATWGSLPQVRVPPGPLLKAGQSSPRVARLRERLGLAPGENFDGAVVEALTAFQSVHGLAQSGTADAATVTALNRGADHYEALIRLNLERLRALPSEEPGRFILVDAAAQRLWLYENGEPVDSMKVVVGKLASPTPMFTTVVRAAEINPYWNVPPDLVGKLIAPKVLAEGVRYLAGSGYEVLSDWTVDAQPVDPASVDWRAVATGRTSVRVRQKPGGGNAMGTLKLVMPNRFGVYLHDTPNRELFLRDDRHASNGCVRLEDATRLARWLFGTMPAAPEAGAIVPIAEPVPVYVTYLTAAVDPASGLVFRADPYGRDEAALAQLGDPDPIQTPSRE